MVRAEANVTYFSTICPPSEAWRSLISYHAQVSHVNYGFLINIKPFLRNTCTTAEIGVQHRTKHVSGELQNSEVAGSIAAKLTG